MSYSGFSADNKPSFSDDIKHEVVKRSLNGEKVMDLAKEFDTTTATIYYWIQQARTGKVFNKERHHELVFPVEAHATPSKVAPTTVDEQLDALINNFIENFRALMVKKIIAQLKNIE